jgi:hypothetical protein
MYPDQIPSDRLPRESSNLFHLHGPNNGSADSHEVPPLPNTPLPNSPIPSTTDNPEFTKWWRRWMSRVRLTARRNPARRFQIGRKNKSGPEDKAAQSNGTDRLSATGASARESESRKESGRESARESEKESAIERQSGDRLTTGTFSNTGPFINKDTFNINRDTFNKDTFNRTDRGEVRHRNNLPPATRAISGEAEFKRYLL